MSEIEHGHNPHGDPNGGSNHHDAVSYWKWARHGWPFWIALFLMLAVMIIYTISDDLGVNRDYQ